MDLKITISVSGASRNYSVTNTVSGGKRTVVDEVIPSGSTDLLVNFAAVAAKAKALCIVSSKDITLETNSAGSPANTFTIEANKPYIWPQTLGQAFKDTANATVTDITALYVTNAAGADARLQIDLLSDPT